jgi:hypothetical protein
MGASDTSITIYFKVIVSENGKEKEDFSVLCEEKVPDQ